MLTAQRFRARYLETAYGRPVYAAACAPAREARHQGRYLETAYGRAVYAVGEAKSPAGQGVLPPGRYPARFLELAYGRLVYTLETCAAGGGSSSSSRSDSGSGPGGSDSGSSTSSDSGSDSLSSSSSASDLSASGSEPSSASSSGPESSSSGSPSSGSESSSASGSDGSSGSGSSASGSDSGSGSGSSRSGSADTSGSVQDIPCCDPDGLPDTLRLQIDVTDGTCGCLDGVQVILHRYLFGGQQWDGVIPKSVCGTLHDTPLSLACSATLGWRMQPNTTTPHLVLSPPGGGYLRPVSVVCDPFQVVFEGVEPGTEVSGCDGARLRLTFVEDLG